MTARRSLTTKIKANRTIQTKEANSLAARIKELEPLAVGIDGNTYYPSLSHEDVPRLTDPKTGDTYYFLTDKQAEEQNAADGPALKIDFENLTPEGNPTITKINGIEGIDL